MSNITIYRVSNLISVQEAGKPMFHVPLHNIGMICRSDGVMNISYQPLDSGINQWKGTPSEVLGITGVAYGEFFSDVIAGYDGGTDVNVQDQHTPALIVPFNKPHALTVTTNQPAIGDTTIDVVSATGFVAGDMFTVFSKADVRFSNFTILSVDTLTITVDTPIDFEYPIGSVANAGSTEMSVNGSVTPQIFGLRGDATAENALPVSFDVTRIIFSCVTDTAVDLSKFADIVGGITNGLVLRKKDGIYRNIFNIKTNAEMASMMYDFTVHDAQNPNQGQHGFVARITFGGPSKIGVVLRLKPGEDLQILVQDQLSTIDSFYMVAEGHVVKDN